MKSPTVNYPRNASYPAMHRRRKRGTGAGCTCDGNYAKSLQGICKIFAILIELLIIIIIGVSPYWKQIFVIGAVNWPFHIVMLITSLMFIATLFMYAFFLSEMHLSHPNIAWPNVELYFNIAMSCFTLLAACLEAGNVWRWDVSQGFQQGFNSNNIGGNGGFNGIQGSQIFPSSSLSGSLNFNSYCVRYPKDCQDYVALLTGNNTYFGNHVFGTILLFLLLVCYIVAAFFAYRTWRVFRRDMVKHRPEGAPLPPPSAWERFRYRMSELKVPKVSTDNIKERFTNMLRRDEEEGEGDVDISPHPNTDSLPPYSERAPDRKSNHGSSTYKSSHHGRSSRHSHSSRHWEDREEERSHRSSSRNERRSENGDRRSHRSGSESRSSKRRSEHRHRDESERRSEKRDSSKKRESSKKSKDKKPEEETQPLSPVASVMC